MTVEKEDTAKTEVASVVSKLLPSVIFPLTKSYGYYSPPPVGYDEPYVLGVDEAGRGPCLGPMVYGISYCPLSRYEELKELGFDDSKKLTEERRETLSKIIEANKDWIGWAVYVISPQDISTSMLQRPVYNLNEMSHDATIRLIREVISKGIQIDEIYVDPVGPCHTYRNKLNSHFPAASITVEPKADSLFPIVSAASIVAKVTRDQFIKNWQWGEKSLEGKLSKAFGSGYTSDPNTIRWLNENEDAFFGFPNIIRFSWKTISKKMDESRTIEWSEDEDEDMTATTKAALKLREERRTKEKKRIAKASVYNHHKKGKINALYSLDITTHFT